MQDSVCIIDKEKISTTELKHHLNEQINFLRTSCKLYDDGNESEAKRIALTLRILLYDTKNSKSILQQLQIKNSVDFRDTAHSYDESNGFSSSCLTYIHNLEIVLPLLDEYKSPQTQPIYIDFLTWWEKNIVLDDKTNRFTRKDLVQFMANQDGGAHVDPAPSPAYRNLTHHNSMNWIVCISGVEKPLENFVTASIRQIAYEVQQTLTGVDRYLKEKQ